MTQKTKQVFIAIVGFVGGGFILAVIGMAAQYWIANEIDRQYATHTHHIEMEPVRDEMRSVKQELDNINRNLSRGLDQQQRFEEIFMEYLRDQTN